MFAGYIKVLGGPQVARGPDVAQAWHKQRLRISKPVYNHKKQIQNILYCVQHTQDDGDDSVTST
jgi:hypothetical protein